MNIKSTTKKLQTALIQKSRIYKIGTYQFYSKEQNRMITGYKVTERQPYRKKNGEMSEKDVELLNTCSQVEVLRWFVEKWRETKCKNGI